MSCRINLIDDSKREYKFEELYVISKEYNLEVIFKKVLGVYIFVTEDGRYISNHFKDDGLKYLLINKVYESDWKTLVRDQKIKELLG